MVKENADPPVDIDEILAFAIQLARDVRPGRDTI